MKTDVGQSTTHIPDVEFAVSDELLAEQEALDRRVLEFMATYDGPFDDPNEDQAFLERVHSALMEETFGDVGTVTVDLGALGPAFALDTVEALAGGGHRRRFAGVEVHGLVLGDLGIAYHFECRTCPDRPVALRVQFS